MTFLTRSLTGIAILMGSATPLLAGPATPAESQRLTTLLQKFVGTAPGAVTVAPAGDSYDVTIDPTAAVAALGGAAGLTIKTSPQKFSLTDQGGGKWLLAQDQAVDLSMTMANPEPGAPPVTAKITVASVKQKLVFDEALVAFTSGTSDMTGFSVIEALTQPDGLVVDVAVSIESLHSEVTGAPAAAGGGIDATVTGTGKGFAETVANVPAAGSDGAGGMPMNFSITAASFAQNFQAKGLMTAGIYGLFGWGAMHRDMAALDGAAQADFKTRAAAALPLFASVSGSSTLTNVAVVTPIGKVGLTSASIEIGANGVVDDGRVHEALAVEGLSLPPGLVPPWAADLVPQKAAIDLTVSDFNLAKPAKLMLDALDMMATPPVPDSLTPLLKAAFLPKGTVQVATEKTAVTGTMYSATAVGSMTAGPDAMPNGKATVAIKGLDAVMAKLQAAPPDVKNQALPVFAMVKGMGKAGADGSTTWDIEMTPEGGVSVNGMPMGGPMKQ